jgi:hypothetical protein
MSRTNVIANLYDRLAQGDNKPILDILSPNLTWIEAENIPYSPGGAITNAADVQRAVFDALAKDFSDFHVNIRRIVEGGDTVMAEGRYAGITKDGQKLDAIFAHIWDFDGAKVVNFQQYSDTWQWRRVLGVDAGNRAGAGADTAVRTEQE